MSSADEIMKALQVKGHCPACGDPFNVNQDETIRQHAVRGNGGYDCPGSWEKAKRVVVDAEALKGLIYKVSRERGKKLRSL
jgi:hypothetical protein